MPDGPMGSFHLENGRLAAYLDRRLSADERAQVEAHLADCADCRAEVVALGRLRRRLARPSPWVIGPALAAAAVAAFLLLGRPPAGPGDAPVLRGGDEVGVTVVPVGPGPGAVVAADMLAFTWRATAPDASYHVTLTDSSGALIWSGVTSDSSTTLPGAVRLLAGTRYYWYVDVLLPDGRTGTSGAQELRTAP